MCHRSGKSISGANRIRKLNWNSGVVMPLCAFNQQAATRAAGDRNEIERRELVEQAFGAHSQTLAG
jgi:hypothetical protein